MKELVEFVVKHLVTNPEAVTVEESRQDGNTNLVLHVDPADMGMVIGKKGQTIRAIRKLLTVRAMAENVRVNLQLFDPGRGESEVVDVDEVVAEATGADASQPEVAEDDAEAETKPEVEETDEKSAA